MTRESGVDEGGPRREMFRLVVDEWMGGGCGLLYGNINEKCILNYRKKNLAVKLEYLLP